MYALDTNTLIFFFKGKGNVARALLEVAPRDVAIPTVVLFELEVGIAGSARPEERRSQLDELLTVVTVLPFDARAARRSAMIRTELAAAGTPIGPMDVLIAGTALANDAILVTHNREEFARVRGLKTRDWF